MPCRSDYMEPNHHERYSKETAAMIVYATEEIDKEATSEDLLEKIQNRLVGDQSKVVILPRLPQWIRTAAREYYGDPQRRDELAQVLCAICRTLEAEGLADTIIYNGKEKKARRLADWWDAHKKSDAAREAAEAREKAERPGKLVQANAPEVARLVADLLADYPTLAQTERGKRLAEILEG